MDKINITVLVENTIRRAGLLAEHGLSLLIEAGGKRVLFDTGQGMALLHNARALGVKLHELDAIVLSHGHYDHTGGLAAVLGESRRIPVYLHPGGLAARFTPSDRGRARGIGIRYRDELILRSRPGDIVWTREPARVLSGISVTGEIPRGTDFEDTGGAFFLDESRP